MDLWVKEKLKDWGLEKLCNIFEDEQVDKETFILLSEETIKKMIPKAGPQTKFLHLWNAEFGLSKTFAPENVLIDPLNNSFTIVSTPTIMDMSTAVNESSSTNVINSERSSEHAHIISEKPFDIIDNVDITLRPSVPITDLVDLLRETAEGCAVLKYYKTNRDLTDDYRNILIELILFAEIRSSPNLTITPERILQLTHLIKLTFPTENVNFYYVPYRLDSVTKQKVCAKGRLYDRYNTHRSLLLQSGVTQSRKGQKRKITDRSAPVRLAFRRDFTIEDCNEDDIEKKVDWLKNAIDPWSTVEKYWADTSKKRIKDLVENRNLLSSQYLEDYPALRDAVTGIILINIDFATLYPEKGDALDKEYLRFEYEIYKYCTTKKKRIEKDLKSLLKTIEREKNCDNSINSKCAAVFRLLPLLLPPPSASKVNENTARRPSKLEVQAEFLLHVKNVTDLESKLAQRRDACGENGGIEQPLTIVVGNTLEEIEEIYVLINAIRYRFSSVIRAIDFAFKSFYALQLDYPHDSQYPWLVVQERIYGIDGETDKTVPCVSKLVSDLRQMSC